MSDYINNWFIFWVCLAWFCECMMENIAFHKHNSWVFKLDLPDSIMTWLKSEQKDRYKYLFGLYDGWHSFKGGMLICQACAIWSLSEWYNGFIFLLLYFLFKEIFFGDILIGGRKL